MWTILNRTPFAVGGTFVCDREGHTTWVVAVRACFSFDTRGRLTRLQEQPAVSRAPAFEDSPVTSSLKFDSDFPYAKVATDVVHVAVVTPDQELSVDELELRREGDPEVGVERERVTRLSDEREVWMPIVENHRRRFSAVRTRLGQPLDPLADAKVLEHPRLMPRLKRLCAAAARLGSDAALDVPLHPRVTDFARVAASLRVAGPGLQR